MVDRKSQVVGLAPDLGLVAVLVVLSWLAERRLFFSGVNRVALREVSVGLWLATACIAGAGFIVGRRRVPEIGVALTAGAGLLHTQDAWPLLPVDLLAVAAIYVVATRRSALAAAASLVAVTTVAFAATAPTLANYPEHLPRPFTTHGGFPAAATLLVIAWFSGAIARQKRVRVSQAERERQEDARRVAERERERIARDIHDIVAHGLTVMIVQAQGAASALLNRPERAATALDAIVETGRSSLAEIRRLLDSDRIGGTLTAAPPPAPGLARLDDLIATANRAGLPTTLTVEGRPQPLPPDIDATAYRIVQEALTNALRHAGCDARASVQLDFTGDSVEVQIIDTGFGTDQAISGGHGLDGIRQRIALLGGSLYAGDAPDRGFQVQARIPL